MLRDAVGENEERKKLNGIKNNVNHTNLFCLSVITRSVISQFCGPYFTVQPAKFPVHSINRREIINILLKLFSLSAL